MDVKKIPPADRDVLADRHERINAAIDGIKVNVDSPRRTLVKGGLNDPDYFVDESGRIVDEPSPQPPEVTRPSRVPVLQPKRVGKDTLEIYGHLLDQHVIVSKRLRELVTRPADSRPESLRMIAAKLFQMLEIVKEMQG